MKSTTSKQFIIITCLGLLTLLFAVATYFWGRDFQDNIAALSAAPEPSPLVERLNTNGYQQLFATPTPLPSASIAPSASPTASPNP